MEFADKIEWEGTPRGHEEGVRTEAAELPAFDLLDAVSAYSRMLLELYVSAKAGLDDPTTQEAEK